MIGTAFYLPGFSHLLNGSRRRRKGLAGKPTRSTDGYLVGRFIPAELFEPKDGQRNRVYPPWVTFIAFLGQVLSRGSACREAVCAECRLGRRRAADRCPTTTRAPTARRFAPVLAATLESAQRVSWESGSDKHRGEKWCGRSVKVIDGTGVSMPDTPENRQKWTLWAQSEAGLRHPSARSWLGMFCLMTGRLVRFAPGHLPTHDESMLARQLIGLDR